MSWEVIIPFLRPIEAYLRDPEISDILMNASGRVFVEKYGRLRPVSGITLGEKSLQVAVRNIAPILGDEVSEERPLLDSRLPDGSRVAAGFPPCSVGGTTLAIRKHLVQDPPDVSWMSASDSASVFLSPLYRAI